MTKKFRNKFRIATTRLKDWDYREGAYFVTVCIKNRQCVLGAVEQDVVHLTPAGEIARECWLSIPEHFLGVDLEAFVVMPNHVHGVLLLDKTKRGKGDEAVPRLYAQNPQMARITPQPGSLAVVIGAFKSIVARRIRKELRQAFLWQERYYDHVIRDSNDYARIAEYIENNPASWALDEENPDFKGGRPAP